MSLTSVEQDYLASQRHGRLATVAPDGRPHNKPVGFRYNPEFETIDIHGFAMEESAKFRNIQVYPDVAFVVDDVVGEGASGVRFLEIRGRDETATDPAPPDPHLSRHFIRVHPRRVLGWNLDPDHPGLHTRDVAAPERTDRR